MSISMLAIDLVNLHRELLGSDLALAGVELLDANITLECKA